jgi:hypothetical protein
MFAILQHACDVITDTALALPRVPFPAFTNCSNYNWLRKTSFFFAAVDGNRNAKGDWVLKFRQFRRSESCASVGLS